MDNLDDVGLSSTTEDVLAGIDLTGTRVLLTGVSSGLGLETARAAANHGATVVGMARDLDKARLALEPHADLGIEVVACELTSLASVRAAADVDLDDPGFEAEQYKPFLAYGRSKTATVLFAVELDRRLRSRGVRGIAVQPGGIRTPLLRHTTPEMMQEMLQQVRSQPRSDGAHDGPPPVKTVEQGAATTVWAAFVASAEEVGGRYCEDCHVAEVSESGRDGVRPYAVDPQRAQALWAKSEELVGERF